MRFVYLLFICILFTSHIHYWPEAVRIKLEFMKEVESIKEGEYVGERKEIIGEGLSTEGLAENYKFVSCGKDKRCAIESGILRVTSSAG